MIREEAIKLLENIRCSDNLEINIRLQPYYNAIDYAIKVLKQESTLDKIRAEIEQIAINYDKFDDYRCVRGLWIALEIIDKYNSTESEDKEEER